MRHVRWTVARRCLDGMDEAAVSFDLDKEIALSRRICAAKEAHNAKQKLYEIADIAGRYKRDLQNAYRRACYELRTKIKF